MALWGQHKNPNIISANFTVVPAVDRQTDVRKQLPKYEKKQRPRADLAWKAQRKRWLPTIMLANSRENWGFVIAWEFRPKAGAEPKFEEAYGSDGVWVQLFRQSEGFVATELSRDAKDTRRYLTLDFWESRFAYEKFRTNRASDYAAIDALCESLTEFEREIGKFERVG